jgi:DNA-binding Lrp family transcriptional regulator
MKKKLTQRLLFELLKDSKRSDRELAKVLGVSQPTVTRRRNKLVEEGIIREFTVIPDFVKMGYEIMAINCFKSQIKKELRDKAEKVTMTIPNIVFAARGHGMGKNAVVISMHKNYADYSTFITNILAEGGSDLEDYDSFVISLEDFVAKPFSLRYLAEAKET